MDVGGVHPREERRAGGALAADEVDRHLGDLVVDALHALLGQRTGVLDPLRPVAVRPRVEDAARAETPPELGEIGGRWVVRVLGFLLGVQVVEVAGRSSRGGGAASPAVGGCAAARTPTYNHSP
jgi:hypothetical protein